jgi:hypothetical protein
MIGILLKEQTKALHDQVEEKLKSHKMMDRSFSLPEYHELLRSNYFFLLEFEDAVLEEKALTADSQDFLDDANRAYRFLLDFKN